MNASIDYELICSDKCTLYFKDDGQSPEEKKEYKVDKEILKEIEEKLNEYKVYKWNGFNESNKYVLDGNSFSITIKYKDKIITAHGYESYQKNYHLVRNYLDKVFEKYIKK